MVVVFAVPAGPVKASILYVEGKVRSSSVTIVDDTYPVLC